MRSSPSNFLFPAFINEHGMGNSFGLFRSFVLAMSPPHLLSTPSPLALEGFGESLDVVTALFSSKQNIGVISPMAVLATST